MKKLTKIFAVAAMALAMPLGASANWSACKYGVMIDPGHGGSDPGAAGNYGSNEANLCLWAGKAMNSWLTGNGCKTRLTRTTNTTVSLSARRSASISMDPQVFCSVHLNAFNGTAHGTETWYYWNNSRHTSLANKVQSQLISKLGTTNRGVKQNGWTVITGASTIPAILTEGLFVDNNSERGLIDGGSESGSQGKAGFKNWVNAHLMGFYNFIKSEGNNVSPSPDASPYGGGGGTVNPPVAQAGTISVASGLHFTGYVGDEPELDLVIKGTNMKSTMTVKANYAQRFPINGKTDNSVTVPAAGGTVKVKFADPYKNNVAGTYGDGGTANIGGTSMNIKFKITISGTGNDGKTVTKEVALSGELKNRPLAPKEKWNISEQKGNKTSKGYDAGLIRNFVYNNGKLYCVYNHKDILVLNAQTGEKLGFLKRGGIVKGGILQLCDVKVIDNKIIACNIGNTETPLRVYSWASDNANPELILETTDMQGAFRVGDCMELSGSYNGSLWLTFGAVLKETNDKTVIVEYNRNNGAWTAKNTRVYADANKTELSTKATVRAYPKNGNFWIDGKDSYPTWATANSSVGGVVRTTFVDTGESWGSCHHEFNYGGQKYSANLVFNSKVYKSDNVIDSEKNYLGGRMRVIADLSGDFTRMQQLGDYPSAGLGSTSRNTNATGDIMINTDGQTYWEGWVLSTLHGIAYYAHGSVPAQSPAKLELQEPETDQPAGPVLSVNPASVSLSAVVGETASTTVKLTGANLKGAMNVTITGDAAFSVAESSMNASGDLHITYAPQAAGTHTATITISSTDAADVKVALKGTATEKIVFSDEINPNDIKEVWFYKHGQLGDFFETDAAKPYTTSIALLNGKLYVLNCKAWGAPVINIVDPYTGSKLGTLNTSGVAGATVQLGSLFVAEGKLYATNVVSAAQTFVIYRWDDLNAGPVKVYELASHNNEQMGRKASFADGKIFVGIDGGHSIYYFPLSNGTVGAPVYVNLKKADGNAFGSASGDGRGSASVLSAGDGTFWITCKDALPTRFKLDGTFVEQMKAGIATNANGTALDIMPFGKQTYAAVSAYSPKLANSSTDNGHMHLFKANDGIAAATAENHIAKLPADGFGGAAKNDQFINTIIHSYRNNNQVLDMWVCIPYGGIAHYSYDGTKPTAVESISADDLNAPVEYFNLQGVKVSDKNLAPGVYIRRQGKTAEKVLVK